MRKGKTEPLPPDYDDVTAAIQKKLAGAEADKEWYNMDHPNMGGEREASWARVSDLKRRLAIRKMVRAARGLK